MCHILNLIRYHQGWYPQYSIAIALQSIAISIAQSQSIAILNAKFSRIAKSIAKYENIAKHFKYCKKHCN